MDNPTCSDLLSDLPLGIIHVILSLVPIKDAVRTSILSRQWRFIWSSLPRLAFNDTDVENYSDLKRLFHFINQALLLHEGPIHEFQLRLLSEHISKVQCQYIDQWLLLLSRNHIRILVIENVEYYYLVHSSLYSCQYLTHLKLRVIFPPLPPSFKGFLFLRSLDIYSPEANSSIIERIVSHSPLLEDLTLDCYLFSETTICALNLKYLQISSLGGHLSLCTPLLQELRGDFDDTTSFSIGVESLVFPYLRTIELSFVSFKTKEVTWSVIHLIMRSPNLQKLQISGCGSSEDDETEPGRFWDTESVPDITYNSLKVIKIRSGVYIDVIKLLKFLVARSPVLETLSYTPYLNYDTLLRVSDEKLQKLTTQLLNYPRASANAQIVVSKRWRRS